MRFPGAIAAMRAGGTINAAVLHFLDFKDGAMHAWNGFGDMVTRDGQLWRGIGDVVAIEGGGQQTGVVANNVTLTLSAPSDQFTDEMNQRAINSENQVYGRRYIMAVQFCDADWQPVDDYRSIYVGVMDRMTFRRNYNEGTSQISLNVESPFVRRRVARPALFSDRDQRAQYNADRGLEFVSGLANKTIKWPKY